VEHIYYYKKMHKRIQIAW